MKKIYSRTKKELKIIRDFLEDYDTGMYYPDEMFTIPKKILKEVEEYGNKNKTATAKVGS